MNTSGAFAEATSAFGSASLRNTSGLIAEAKVPGFRERPGKHWSVMFSAGERRRSAHLARE